ncbi:GTP-binding protein [Synechococcus sp. KORDI-100]|uniref:GTP-binding protein n=1 Tax=Synechococcus sp. KORDI-100 TaxID=1280380 RepID=UPI00056E543D|nr:GTP-binding protein [Synechococcus sp. KORDI-100]
MHQVSIPPPASIDRCWQLLQRWRSELKLTRREQGVLAGSLVVLDRQLERLKQRRLRIAVFGRVGVGKSSLINALIGTAVMETDVAHGNTRRQQAVSWPISIPGLTQIELIDTPGIDEIQAAARARLARRIAMEADLVLLVIDSDLSRTDQDALDVLQQAGKPLHLVLNGSDRWQADEIAEVLSSIRSRLSSEIPITAVAAAPRRPVIDAEGRVRSEPIAARIEDLRVRLHETLEREGALLLALQSLSQADRFQHGRQQLRLQQHRRRAQGLIGRFAAAKATGVAANPVMALDLAAGMACDTALVMQLCQLYDLPLAPSSARQLIRRLSQDNALLAGIQLGLTALKQALILMAPISGGVTLAPAAPVAVAQAALAVHTTKRTGQLVAEELMRGLNRCGGQPGALLTRLSQSDPVVRCWMERWGGQRLQTLQPLLP